MRKFTAGVLAACFVGSFAAAGNCATIYSLNINGGGTTGASPYGQVTVDDAGGILDVTVKLFGTFQFHDAPDANHNSFLFDLVGIPRVDVSVSTAGFARLGTNPAPGVTGAGVYAGPSFNEGGPPSSRTFWSYAIDGSCDGNACGQDLHFTVTHVGAGPTNTPIFDLSLSSLASLFLNPNNIYFVAAIINTADGSTGNVGATFLREEIDPPTGTPVPGALVLMGTVLAGGFGFGAVRRRRAQKVS